MSVKTILAAVKKNITTVAKKTTSYDTLLWKQFIHLHPADIAQFLSDIERDNAQALFVALPKHAQLSVFSYLTETMKVFALSLLDDKAKGTLLRSSPVDELTDLFDSLSDEELKDYINLLSTQDRKKVLSLLEFDPESVGGIMNTDVLSLQQDFTVEKSIQILQRLQPRKELHKRIYVTNQDNHLVGHIHLADLVLKHPKTRLIYFMKTTDLILHPTMDREDAAQKMLHYNLMIAPVISEESVFLGVLSAEQLLDIVEQEASEDVYRISAMAPMKQTYFDTSFFKILRERSSILVVLLVAQMGSTFIQTHYEAVIGSLWVFITMLISTGGNSSSQTSSLVIQGMASGEIHQNNIGRFLRREILMAILMAGILGVVSFARVFWYTGDWFTSTIVSLSLAFIVMFSVVLGSGFPIILKRWGWDPAFAAGPFLATIMDILGLLIYSNIIRIFLGG